MIPPRCPAAAFTLLAGILVLMTVACGDDSASESDGGDAVDVPGFDVFLEDGGVTGVVPEGAAPALLIRAWCENRVRCECSFTDEVEDCVDTLLPDTEMRYASYREMGLTYDPACVTAVIDEILTFGCGETLSPLAYPPACGRCPIYFGDVPSGSECMLMGTSGFTLCEQGMSCVGELGSTTCGSGCDAGGVYPIRIGEPCDDNPEGCTLGGGTCEADVCQPLPTVGEPCLENACGVGGSCDSGICVVAAALGEPCEEPLDCATGICVDGECGAICFRPRPF